MPPTGHRGRTLAALACLFAGGCSTMHELPRAEYAARPERKGVMVETREGLHYKFDVAHFSPDSLTGEHMRDTEGAFEEYTRVTIPLESIAQMKVRRTSWLRTGVIAGGVAVAAATAVAAKGKSTGSTDNGQDLPPADP